MPSLKIFEILHIIDLDSTSADGETCTLVIWREKGLAWIGVKMGIRETKIDVFEEDGILLSAPDWILPDVPISAARVSRTR